MSQSTDSPPPLPPPSVQERIGQPRGSALGCFVVALLFLVLGLLLLPAISKVREPADRMLCASNLRRIAIAAHDYHGDHFCLPPGYLGPMPNETDPTDANGPHVSFLAFLLPYLDEAKAELAANPLPGLPTVPKDQAAARLPAGPAWWSQPAGLTAATLKLQMLRCPDSDNDWRAAEARLDRVAVLHHYHRAGDDGPTQHLTALTLANSPTIGLLGATSYVGVSGGYGYGTHPEKAKYVGILGNRTAHNCFTSLFRGDSFSETLFIGESLGGYTDGQRTILHSWMGSGAMSVAGGLVPVADQPSLHQFSSVHRGIVQFAFADASVRGLRFTPTTDLRKLKPGAPPEAYRILLELAGYRDGGKLDASLILD